METLPRRTSGELEEVIQRYQATVFGLALARTGSRADAEDVDPMTGEPATTEEPTQVRGLPGDLPQKKLPLLEERPAQTSQAPAT